jgi:hypothetical protein
MGACERRHALTYDFTALATGRAAAADVLAYIENNPTRLIVIRKDGTGESVVFEQPPGMVYHHGNLTETGDVISFYSLMSPDDRITGLHSAPDKTDGGLCSTRSIVARPVRLSLERRSWQSLERGSEEADDEQTSGDVPQDCNAHTLYPGVRSQSSGHSDTRGRRLIVWSCIAFHGFAVLSFGGARLTWITRVRNTRTLTRRPTSARAAR